MMNAVAICDHCGAAFDIAGPLGIVPHILAIHANSEEARRIREQLLGDRYWEPIP